MECSEIKEYLYEYKTKRLDEERFNEVDGHLKECKRCQLELEELGNTLTILQYVRTPKLSEGFKDKVMDRMNNEEKKKTRWKWVLQGTVAASIILVAVTISRITFPPEIEKIPRKVGIVTELAEVKNPIFVEVTDVKESFEKLTDLIKQYNGQIVRKSITDSRIEVIFKIVESEEISFFQELSKIGEMQLDKEGFKDSQGNIVVILNRLGK